MKREDRRRKIGTKEFNAKRAYSKRKKFASSDKNDALYKTMAQKVYNLILIFIF